MSNNVKVQGPLPGTGMTTILHEGDGRTRNTDDRTLRDVDSRLSRIEGQIRGIRNMTSEGRICVDVVTQIAAVRAALKKVADVLVADHVESWLREASSNPGIRGKQDVEELLQVFTQTYR